MNNTKNRSGLPWCILYSTKLDDKTKLVFIALKDRAYQVDKTCTKGFLCKIDWLITYLNMNRKTVEEAIKNLKNTGIIKSKRVRQYGATQNEWTIDWDLIDAVGSKFRFKNEIVDVIDDEPDEIEDIPDFESIVEEEITPTPTVEKAICVDDKDFRYKEADLSFLDEEPAKEDSSYEQELKTLLPELMDEYGNINYNKMKTVVPALSIKYGVPKAYVDDDIIKALNSAA